MVIVSHRGWDGSRILGIFNSLDEAKDVTKDFIYDSEKDELIFDIMEIGKLSLSAYHKMQDNNGVIERNHHYISGSSNT